MHPVERYLTDLREIHRTGGGTAEESFYGPLESLLNEVGAGLSPRVRCVSQLRNVGAGEPDFGLYSANQFQRSNDDAPMEGQPPERGVIEVKGWNDDSFVTADSEQVSRYWERYGLVLVTNYRDFVIVGQNERGRPVRLESYRMAESLNGFLGLLEHPRRTANDQGDRLVEFLLRAMLHESPLTAPEDLAWFLASYAREARARVEETADLPALESLKKGLEEALGMRFQGERGEHFFRATLVQTLFYGVFSSWVLWSRDRGDEPEARFKWREAGWTLHVPMIASLFNQIATPQRLKPLGVDEVLDWAGLVLNRVDRGAFFSRFEEEHAVQYFYEPFLQAYDPELRKELGVWYTPPEIVKYQVERVDRVLREELEIADGLADDQVVILDPCCGTGAYLVETLKRIHRTLEEQGGGALMAQKLKRAARERVFGFELLPAPFVVSHLQLGLMLRQLGAPLDHDTDERVAVYLTNALTGWEPVEHPRDLLDAFPDLRAERDAANAVKQEKPIIVILGNPPYNAFAGTSPEEEGGLVDVYKDNLATPIKDGGWGIKKYNLDDLYVRFFRIAERRILKSGKGIISYISNFSYLSDPSFVVMRKRLLDEFDIIAIDCMNGDSRETGKLTPDGESDPSVFSTVLNKAGIRVGTAICMLIRTRENKSTPLVCFRDFWGIRKREDLVATLDDGSIERKYQISQPVPENRFSFRPDDVKAHYREWPLMTELAAVPPSNGLMEKRGGALIDMDPDKLATRMKSYFDRSLGWERYARLGYGMERKRAGMIPEVVRSQAIINEGFDANRIVRYALRPFDTVYAYYTSFPGIWNRSRRPYARQCVKGNSFLMTRPNAVASPEGNPICFTTVLGDNDFQRGHSYYFPIRLIPESSTGKTKKRQALHFDEEKWMSNLSASSKQYLRSLNCPNPDTDAKSAHLIWMHCIAIGYSPKYLAENSDGVRENWPRIPLPASRDVLLTSADVGWEVASLLNTEKGAVGVTSGKILPTLSCLGSIRKTDKGQLNPAIGDLEVTAGWGHGGKGGVCMPGKGKTESRTQTDGFLKERFGEQTLDVYLNDSVYWSNIPVPVWDYTIGGYQVIKKWLSYREKAMLGRGLKIEEAEYVTEMVRRIAALILLQPELNANYAAVKADVWQWPR